jgi:hypothetical protein
MASYYHGHEIHVPIRYMLVQIREMPFLLASDSLLMYNKRVPTCYFINYSVYFRDPGTGSSKFHLSSFNSLIFCSCTVTFPFSLI